MNTKTTIYYLGNPLVRVDKKPIEAIPRLIKSFSDVLFVHVDPTENINLQNHILIVMDTVLGINRVTVFNNLQEFSRSPRYSPHDYDLLTDAVLLQKLGKIKDIIVIGIPAIGNLKEIVDETKLALNNILHI